MTLHSPTTIRNGNAYRMKHGKLQMSPVNQDGTADEFANVYPTAEFSESQILELEAYLSILPSNAEKYPISELIEKLQALPEGTTYKQVEGVIYGGQTDDKDGWPLGTSYQMRLDICEGMRE